MSSFDAPFQEAELLQVVSLDLLRCCGLSAAGQLVLCNRLWTSVVRELLPKVAESFRRGLLLARADYSQLLRCDVFGEWHEEELPQGAPAYLNCAAAFYLEHLFVVGGGAPYLEHCVDSAAALDFTTRCWRQLQSMPTARSRCAAVGAEESLVVLGGLADHPLDAVEALPLSGYCLHDALWNFRPHLPEPLSDCTAIYLKQFNEMAILGDTGAFGASLFMFASNIWRNLQLPRNRLNPSLAACSKCLFIIGGMRPDEDVGFVDVYDLQVRSWSANLTLPDLHEPRSSAIAFAANGRIYVLGGHQVGPVEYVETLDLWSGRWQQQPDLPERFASTGTASMVL